MTLQVYSLSIGIVLLLIGYSLLSIGRSSCIIFTASLSSFFIVDVKNIPLFLIAHSRKQNLLPTYVAS